MSKQPGDDEPKNEKPLPQGLRAEDILPAHAGEPPVEAKTLSGDIRDAILTHIRSMKVPWSLLNEQEQGDKIDAATRAGEDLVRVCLQTIAKNKLPSLQVNVGAYKVDKTLEVKLTISPTVSNITMLAEHGTGGAMLILAEASDYFGERAPAKPQRDQPKLPLNPDGDDD